MKIYETPFNIKQTFDCGQCFRFNQNKDGSYTGVAVGRVITLRQEDGFVETDSDDSVWNEYFDLGRDYNEVINALSKTDIMKNAISKGNGIRILKQEFFETVISFIISQNNNIPRIKGIIESLCRRFGKKIKDGYYAFPEPETVAELKKEDLAFLKAGYRDVYITDAARKIANGEIDKNILLNAPIDEARKEISKIKGVGPKVCDCILLFYASRGEVFPTDVWMKKVLSSLYGLENLTPKEINLFAEKNFGNLAGYAQQYLFYSMRESGK